MLVDQGRTGTRVGGVQFVNFHDRSRGSGSVGHSESRPFSEKEDLILSRAKTGKTIDETLSHKP